MKHCFTGEMFARTDVWLLRLWFVSVNSVERSSWNSRQRSFCNKRSFISMVLFHQVINKMNTCFQITFWGRWISTGKVRYSKTVAQWYIIVTCCKWDKVFKKTWESIRNITATINLVSTALVQGLRGELWSLQRDGFSTTQCWHYCIWQWKSDSILMNVTSEKSR